MNESELTKSKKYLPTTVEELAKFILIGREKLTAVRALIRAVDKLDLAKDVREQKLQEGQMLGGALLDAEARMGELLKENPPPKFKQDTDGYLAGTIGSLPEGISKKLSHYCQQLAEHPDLIEQVKAEAEENEDIPTRSEVLRKIKEKNRAQRSQEIIPLPPDQFDVLYADPPWEYRNTGVDGAAIDQYPTMSIEKLCQLKVKDLTTENAVLFLWTTNPILEECFPVIHTWGFQYKTNFCWVKENKKTGIGFYVRGVHELLLICVRGSMLPRETPLSVISANTSGHSVKPILIYDLIERMYPSQLPLLKSNGLLKG